MEKNIKKFLALSAISMIVICVLVFTWLTVFLSDESKKTIYKINELYMSEINAQLYQKFDIITSFRQDQIGAIIENNPPTADGDEWKNGLIRSAKSRGFEYVALYTKEGKIDVIYGEPMEIVDNDNAIYALEKTGYIVELGLKGDEKRLIIGKETAYPMSDGGVSDALIVGLPMEYLNKALYLYHDENHVYSHIIAPNGDFIIRNGSAYRDNYFDRMLNTIDVRKGKTPQQYVDELKAAIAKGETYMDTMQVNGEDRYIYCTQIADDYCNWYLISIMRSGEITDIVREQDAFRIRILLGSTLAILLVMVIIFITYYRMSNSHMRQLEAARSEASRANAAKSEFLSSMSHDIRTPMNAIVGMTEIAIKNKDNTLRVEDCLEKIKLSSKHLLGLINDVLDMSKIESGKMTLNLSILSLKETIDDIVNIMKPQLKARDQYFDIFIEKIQTEDVYCDSTRLNQILLNLLSNAVKFTPEGGSVYVYLYQENSPLGDNYIRTHFRVKDTGIGMSEEFQKKVFDSFARENTKQVQNITGTGLGMAITKHIVDLMNGTIEVKSKINEGSEFHITLDLERAGIKEDDMVLPKWDILVVDDNDQLCSSAVSSLEEMGVNAESALDGMTALKMIEERHNKNNDYDFALIDWRMPGMDGMQLVREIRDKVLDTPVFLISAYDYSDIEEEAMAADIKGFISKPLFKSKLYTCLSNYIAEDGHKTDNVQFSDREDVDFSGKRILLAEDIDMNWEIANEILTSAGFEVDRAVNGQVCVDMFKASELNHYDAILMDIRMPVMTGYEATVAIRALDREDKDIPIIAMTADAFSDDVQRCLDCGMNAHTAKPINIKELFSILKRHFDK